MGSQWSRDKAYLRAKHEGYRSRASYKLIEIQDKFSVIRRADNIVDLGAAPGSWLQVLRKLTDGIVVGVDLNPIAPINGIVTIEGDFTDPATREQIRTKVGQANVVVSDASPRLSGHKSYDQARSAALVEEALEFGCSVLKPGGNFVAKVFQGTDLPGLLAMAQECFHSVRTYHTRSTRKGSTELYLVAKNFKGNTR
jgi:23S rRNA (uridine2552-2'-O)-methyltransferase